MPLAAGATVLSRELLLHFASMLFTGFYVLVAATLVTIALAVTGGALWDLVVMFAGGEFTNERVLERVTLVIIAMAIIDVAKYLWEEEVLRDRELRSVTEARQSLTHFMVIICIAVSLEALLHLARVHNDPDLSTLLYPAALLTSAVFAMVGLGVYQRLSMNVERKNPDSGRQRPRER